MSEDKKKLGSMFELALANRAKARKEEEEKQNVEEEKENVQGQEDNKQEEKEQERENNDEENIIEEDEVIEEDQPIEELEENELKDVLENQFQKQFEEVLEKDENEDTEETVNQNETVMINVEDLEDFPEQPFKVYTEEKESEMIDSIKVNGIIQDLIVRPLPSGKYQILSGHNRKNCAIKAGLQELPCKIRDVDDDTAKLMLVDTNLVQRKDFYPSEVAKALKVKRDVYRKKEVKSNFFDEISKEQNMSRGNIQRYLRLNFLTPELLGRVDTGEINIKVAEDISFLRAKEQKKLEELIEARAYKVNSNQAKRLREESDNKNLSDKVFFEILEHEEKVASRDIEIKFNKNEVEKYFKDFNDAKEIKDFIVSILDELVGTPNKEGVSNG